MNASTSLYMNVVSDVVTPNRWKCRGTTAQPFKLASFDLMDLDYIH